MTAVKGRSWVIDDEDGDEHFRVTGLPSVVLFSMTFFFPDGRSVKHENEVEWNQIVELRDALSSLIEEYRT